MNLKIMGLLLVFMGFMNNHAVENIEPKIIKYSEIVAQLIEAKTLDDAKVILKEHETIDQNILREHLITRQNLWFAEHGLYDKVIVMHTVNEILKYGCSIMSAGGLSLFALHFFLITQGFNSSEAIKTTMQSGIFGVMCGFIAWCSFHDSPIIKKQIHEFKRIKELLAFVG